MLLLPQGTRLTGSPSFTQLRQTHPLALSAVFRLFTFMSHSGLDCSKFGFRQARVFFFFFATETRFVRFFSSRALVPFQRALLFPKTTQSQPPRLHLIGCKSPSPAYPGAAFSLAELTKPVVAFYGSIHGALHHRYLSTAESC